MIDDHVHVGHNASIGNRNTLTAGTVIGGSVRTGSDVWFGLNCSIRNGIRIGQMARISMGSVVTQDVADGVTVTGNFAIPHEEFIDNLREARKANERKTVK
jgi:UDP-3-O-[3-hydroxymyristoyl] glucosamine N-acyltransferase